MAQSNEQGGELRERLSQLDKYVTIRTMREPLSNDSFLVEQRLKLSQGFIDEIVEMVAIDRKQHELEARIQSLTEMRDQMFNMYHIVGATMNDKEAISQFDYEFEERIAELKAEREAL